MRLFAMVVLVALGCGPKGPVVAPGQVVVKGDTTFRTQQGNKIEVTVKKSWEGHDAIGTATIHGMTLEAAQHSAEAHVATGRAWIAVLALVKDDRLSTWGALQRGLDELGTDYRYRKGHAPIDDTGNTVRFAEDDAKQGNLDKAIERASKVLDERLELYLHVFSDTVQ